MMRLNKVGTIVLNAGEEFEKYEARKLRLRDVFKLRREFIVKKYNNIEPSESLENPPTNEEIEQYIRAKEEYIADAILKECGWEDFVKRCKKVGIEDYIAEQVACKGPEGQCNMFCPKYFDCIVI